MLRQDTFQKGGWLLLQMTQRGCRELIICSDIIVILMRRGESHTTVICDE